MPDAPVKGSTGGKNLGFLGRKLGPAPVWLWAALAIGAYYLYTKYKGGSSSSAAAGAAAVDPATGVTYAQEISDAEGTIQQLQAQLNSQSQGQTAPPAPDITNVTVNDTEATPPPAPKPAPDHDPKSLASANYRDLAIQSLKDKGIRNPSAQQIADEQNDIRATVGLGKAVGKPPAGGGTDTGVTTKAKARAKPKRPAPTRLKSPPAVRKTVPLKRPARRAA